MINLISLQKAIDKTFLVGSDYRVRQAREGSNGFFISCPILTKAFIEWLESHYDCRFKNVQYDNENLEYVKAFFEELAV
jgi:hypothetical protein